MGEAAATLAIGEHMRKPGEALAARSGVPLTVIPTATGLEGADALITWFAKVSGRPVPPKLRRARSRLIDAMLDGHFHFGGKRLAIAGEPDMLAGVSTLAASLGAEIAVAVSATGASPVLASVPAAEVLVGDLGLLEEEAEAKACDMIIANAHADMAAERLGLPLFRLGFPVFDRLGSQHQATIGYEGAMRLIFAISNLFQASLHKATPEALNPFLNRNQSHDRAPQTASH
jgi:nitrogenase molybdenum-iron protein NifN